MNSNSYQSLFLEWREAVYQLARGKRSGIRDLREHPLLIYTEPAVQIAMGISHAKVDDFGTFEHDSNAITLVRFLVRLVDVDGGMNPAPFPVARFWFTEVFGAVKPVYRGTTVNGWANATLIMFFLNASANPVQAPADFAWSRVSPYNSNAGFEVQEISDLDAMETIYNSTSDTIERGRRVTFKVHPSSSEEIGNESFVSLVKRLTIKGAVGSSIHPVSLTWSAPNSALFVFENSAHHNQRFQVDLTIPTEDDLKSKRFLIPGSLTPAVSPEQFSEGLIGWLYEMIGSGALRGNRVDDFG